MITRDNEPLSVKQPPPTQKKRSGRSTTYVSPRAVGIATTSLQNIMANACLKKTRQTVKIDDIPFDPESMTNGVVRQVPKSTLTKYKHLIADPIT